MPKQQLNFLLQKCMDQTATPKEKLELQQLLTDPANAEILQSFISTQLEQPATLGMAEADKDSIINAIFDAGKYQPAKVAHINRSWIKYAAAVVVVLSLASYYLTRRMPDTDTRRSTVQDHPPGSNKATLTLADGTIIVLDSASNSTLATQGNTTIIKLNSGQLAYQSPSGSPADSSEHLLNTISTPKGGQYQIILPDGSTAWLNAASQLSFPAQFTGVERKVKLIGEAYFDIKKNAAKPFVVTTDKSDVLVLGTEFNVMAYSDELEGRTTLINGSVSIQYGSQKSMLSPGQQASISGQQLEILKDANVEEAIAWKNGRFFFNGADIRSIMRQISRWYDVEIVFEGQPGNEKFVGEISRNSPLTEVLKIVELTSSYKFRTEKNKLIVQQ